VVWSTLCLSLEDIRLHIDQELLSTRKKEDRLAAEALKREVFPILEAAEEEVLRSVQREEQRKKKLAEEEERKAQIQAMEAAGLVRRSSRSDSLAEAEEERKKRAAAKEEERRLKQIEEDARWELIKEEERKKKAIRDAEKREEEKRLKAEQAELNRQKREREKRQAELAKKTKASEGLPADAWIACDQKKCGKWRRVSQQVADSISDNGMWFCEDNYDHKFNRCDIRQELSNKAITELMAREEREQLELAKKRARESREKDRRSITGKRGYHPDEMSVGGGAMMYELEPRKRGRGAYEEEKPVQGVLEESKWVQCESCETWRRLPRGVEESTLPDIWKCGMSPLPYSRCGQDEGPLVEETVPVLVEEKFVGCERCEMWRVLPAGFDESSLPDLWVCGMFPLTSTICNVESKPPPSQQQSQEASTHSSP